jgi:hypothetical protein
MCEETPCFGVDPNLNGVISEATITSVVLEPQIFLEYNNKIEMLAGYCNALGWLGAMLICPVVAVNTCSFPAYRFNYIEIILYITITRALLVLCKDVSFSVR